MSKPLVSIIMNCYNGEKYLREAIDSICSQTYNNWEVIFWDNASTDDSATIAESYDERVKYHLAPKTTPLGEARNLALTKVSGKYVAFLDCDDLYLPDKLEKQVRLMEDSDYAMCYSSVIIIDDGGRGIKKKTVKNQGGFLLGALLNHYEIPMPSVMIRHRVLSEEHLGFEVSLKYCPDFNLFMEIASRYPVGVNREFLVKYRVVFDSLSKKKVYIAATETQFTLDGLKERSPELLRKFAREFENAYQKLHYYNAVAEIYRGNRKLARQEVRTIWYARWEYLALYFLLVLPLPNRFVLKILRR